MAPRSRRSLLGVVAAALPAAVAGCAADPATSTDLPTSTDTPTPVGSPTATTERTSNHPENVTDYGNLSTDAKAFFRTLFENGSVERPLDRVPPGFPDLGEIRRNGTVVRRNGTRFEVEATRGGGMVAVYTLRLWSAGSIDAEDATVVAFPELPADGKAAVEQAIESGEYTHRGPGLAEELFEHRYLDYRGNYYEIRLVVGDVPVWEFVASNASG